MNDLFFNLVSGIRRRVWQWHFMLVLEYLNASVYLGSLRTHAYACNDRCRRRYGPILT